MLVALRLSSAFLLIAYLLGSLPTGYWAGRWLTSIDIREHGSGSTGATNVLRTLGKPAAITVLVIDMAKGMLAVAVVRAWFTWSSLDWIPLAWQPWLIVGAATGAIMGHSKSILLNFSGGKSVATSLGVLWVMNPWLALGTLGSFLVMLALTRIVSLSSITGAVAVNLFVLLLHQPLPYFLFSLVAGTYVILRHQTNIQRLRQGTEPKLGQKSATLAEPSSPL